METSTHFFPGSTKERLLPLDRYLPPYRYGSLKSMLASQKIHNGWVLDPLGSHPLAAIELAQAGYQVFVASNNPIFSHFYQVLCQSPDRLDIQAALSEFAALRQTGERLEVQIKKKYLSLCPKCSQPVQAVYLWKKEEEKPYAKEVNCPHCLTNEVFPVDEEDFLLLNTLGNVSLHRIRAIQRVGEQVSSPSQAVQEVIQNYLPRSLSVITTMINRIEAMKTSKAKVDLLTALMIIVCDYGNMMWPVTSGTSRPKQVYTPAEFKEFPLWKILEDNIDLLTVLNRPVPLTLYPQTPPTSGGICLYPHRMRQAQDFSGLPDFQAVATILPRPNQALWTLSAIWAGWIWGAEAAQNLKGALERRRYDWLWHTQALKRLFDFSHPNELPWFAIAPELTPGYTLSFLSAAESAGYQLEQFAFQPEFWTAQFYWKHIQADNRSTNPDLSNLETYLQQKGQPASYQELYILHQIIEAQSSKLLEGKKQPETSLYSDIQKDFENIIKDKTMFRQIDQDKLEYGSFWLAKPPEKFRPLSEQIELAVIRFLQNQPETDLNTILLAVNSQQPGYLPADEELLVKILESYCELNESQPKSWTLRPQETSANRKQDIANIHKMLLALGQRFDLLKQENPVIIWEDKNSGQDFRFFITASSIVSRFYDQLFDKQSYENVIVYPGSRAIILNHKIRNDPVFAEKMRDIHFLKFRHLRSLYQDNNLSFKEWKESLELDPPQWQDMQQPSIFS